VSCVVAGVLGASRQRAGRRQAVPVVLNALPKALEGTGGPLPNDVWDPLNLMEGKTEEQILYWRAVELKHSRVAMLAVLGWIHVAGGWHFIGDAANGYVRVSDDPLINVTQLSMGGAWQVVFTILALEWLWSVPCPPPKEAPWDVLGWSAIVETGTEEQPFLGEPWKERQLFELNNGRLAMFAILGLIAQDAYTGDYGGAIFYRFMHPLQQGDFQVGSLMQHPGNSVFDQLYPQVSAQFSSTVF